MNKEKLLIKLLSSLSFSSKKRKRIRKVLIYRAYKKRLANAKWGVSYSVFDGEELLEASIMSIKNSVDYINVVYQTESWYGSPASENLVPFLEDLKNRGLVDELIEYKANSSISAGRQERNKRQLGLDASKKANVTYFMTMDCDEFYRESEVENAKRTILEKNIDFSFCNILNYGLSPNLRCDKPTPSFIQFFSKIETLSKLGENKEIITLVDPTRCLANTYRIYSIKQYFLHGVEMHHMTHIRKNIDKKLKNSSSPSKHTANINNAYSKMNFIETPDIFNLLPIIKGWKTNNEI